MTTPAASSSGGTVREYRVRAETSRTFGRVLAGAREQHMVVDGPVGNGCPGEAITPAELFLMSVASCGAELVQVIARDEGVPVEHVAVAMTGEVDRGRQARADVTTFTRVRMELAITSGADDARVAALVEGFRRR